MPHSNLLAQIDADIGEAERLIAELRLEITLSQRAGESTIESEARIREMLKGAMLLQDQRQKVLYRRGSKQTAGKR